MLVGIPHSYEDGRMVFLQGDPAADLYVIRSGTVRIVRSTAEGEIELAVLGDGDFFGEMGLFAPGPRSATAIAVGKVEVDVIDRPGFMAAINDPIIWEMFSKMSKRIRHTNEVLGDPPAAEGNGDEMIFT